VGPYLPGRDPERRGPPEPPKKKTASEQLGDSLDQFEAGTRYRARQTASNQGWGRKKSKEYEEALVKVMQGLKRKWLELTGPAIDDLTEMAYGSSTHELDPTLYEEWASCVQLTSSFIERLMDDLLSAFRHGVLMGPGTREERSRELRDGVQKAEAIRSVMNAAGKAVGTK
jgi:hypothetical protein